jgi:hypothetical protein
LGPPANSPKVVANKTAKQLTWLYFIVVVFWGCIVVLGLTVYRWNAKKEAAEGLILKEDQDRAVHFVKQSMADSPGLLTAVTKNFLGQPQDIYVDIDSCHWDGYPLWHGSPKNPSFWFSRIKDIDGYHVRCIVYVQKSKDNDAIIFEDEMQFTWDVLEDGEGITAFRSQFYYEPVIP